MGKTGPKRLEHKLFNGIETKYCTKCLRWKNLSMFYNHVGKWDGLSHICRECSGKINHQRYKNNPDYFRQYRINNYEHIHELGLNWRKRNQNYMRQWYTDNKDRAYFNSIKYRYGISYEQWNKLLDAQGDVCSICKCLFKGTKDCHVEHNHLTGQIRGIVCKRCNNVLSLCKDNINILNNLITYIQTNNNYGSWYQSSGPTYYQWKQRMKRNILIKQLHKCPGCNTQLSIKSANLDHSHKTMIIRGCLCRECNLILGYIFDSADILEYTVKYLKYNNSDLDNYLNLL